MPRKQAVALLPPVVNGNTTNFLELLKSNSVPVAVLHFLKSYQHAMPYQMDAMYASLEDCMAPARWSKLRSKWGGSCIFCGDKIIDGHEIFWRRVDGKSYVTHISCMYEACPYESMTDELARESVDVLRKKLEECRQVIDELLAKVEEHDSDRS